MARPRFAPTGQRATTERPNFNQPLAPLSPLPRLSATPQGTPSGRPDFHTPSFAPSGPSPFTPQEQANLDVLGKIGALKPYDIITNHKLTPQQKEVALEIAQRYQRPSTTMNVIGRVLNFFTNVSAGVATAGIDKVQQTRDNFSDGVGARDLIEALPGPLIFGMATNAFKDVPLAVYHNKTYEDVLKESYDPQSFMYRHSMPIGLAMDIAFDPTTYLTLGSTAGSKAIARGLLVASYSSSFAEANDAIKVGHYVHASGQIEKVAANENVWDLAGKIHMLQGRPFMPGDAMEMLKQSDLSKVAITEAIDAGLKPSLRARQKATFRALAPRGGFGVRLAGQQLIPAKATDTLAAKTREAFDAIPGVTAKPSTFTSATTPAIGPYQFKTLADFNVIPAEKFGKLSEDVLRTMLTDTTRQIPRDAAFLMGQQLHEARDLFKIDSATGATIADAGVIARATGVMRKIFVEDSPYVPYEYRKNLLREDYKAGGLSNPYNKRLAEAKRVSLATRDAIIQQAKDMGWPESEVKALDKRWQDLVNKNEDPLDVVSKFQIHVGARIYSQQQMDAIFANPMFAAVVSEHTGPLQDAADEADRLTEAWQRGADNLKSAKARKNKSLITRRQNELSRLTTERRAANVEYNRLRDLQKSELGGRVLADTQALGRRLGQDTVIETWRGKKYAVPKMVSDSVREMRNPHVLDKKLERALKTMNWAQSKWKILATTVNASFHVMNLVGAMWNNMLGGTNNLFDHVQGYASVVNARAEASGKAAWAGKDYRRFSPRQLNVRRLSLHAGEPQKDTHLQEYVLRSGAGGGQIHYDIHGEGQAGKLLTKDISGITVPGTGGKKVLTSSSKSRKILTASRRGYAGAAVGAAILPNEWVPDDVQDTLNPMLGAALLLPEGVRLGRRVGSDVEDTVRTAPFIAVEKDQSVRQLMDAFSVSPPTQWGKYMGQEVLDLDQVQREAVYAVGARNAIHYQFDYADLSDFERYAAKTVFPFWVFYKNNLILQAREVVNKPRYVNTFLDISNYMNSLSDNEGNPYFKEMLPEYFDKLNMFKVPVPNFIRDQLGIQHDQEVYLNPKLPFASLNLFPPLWQAFSGDESVTPTPNKWAQVLAPVFGAVGPMAGGGPIKPLLEYEVGYNLGLARPIDFQRAQSNDYRQSSTPAPGYLTMLPGPMRDWFGVYKDPKTGQYMMHASIKYVADQIASPFIASTGDALATFSGPGEATDQQKANTVAWLTGIRLSPVDPVKLQRGWLYRMENFLEAQKSDSKARGIEFPQDDDHLLRQIRAQLRVVERAYDAQQTDLYGPKP